jgi:phosphocarrier protein
LILLKRIQYTVTDKLGIHARPAGLLVKAAGDFASDITFEKEGRSASAKKLFSLMSLGVRQGDVVTVTAEGPDEGAAIAAVQRFLEEHL